MSNSTVTNKRKYFPAVDVVKFIFSVIVIAVHTNPLKPQFPLLNFIIINVFGRIVVPFFFVSTSYFFARGLKAKGEGYFKSYIIKLIKMYIMWFIIYLPFGIYRLPDMISFEITPLIGLGVLLEAFFLHGSYFHLWYLVALIIGITLVYLLQKKVKFFWILLITILLFIFGLSETYIDFVQKIPIVNSISDFYFEWFITTRNGFFFGLIFVALGFQMGYKGLGEKWRHPGWISLVFFILLMSESLLLREFLAPLNYNLLIMQVPFTIFFFEYVRRIEVTNKTIIKNIGKLSEYSTLFYFTHAMFLELIPLGLALIKRPCIWNQGWFRFLSVLIFTYLLSDLIIELKNKKKKKSA